MHLLYCDESGSTHDPKQRFFVLAGMSVFERQSYWLATELDKIASRFNEADPASVELHGSPMNGGKGNWRNFPKEERTRAMADALQVFERSTDSNRLFACVIDKAKISPRDPVLVAFEQLASRFDHYLMRLHKRGDTQRGLLIFDKTSYESTLQNLASDFRTYGHTWGVLRNLAEVPLFIDSKASRLTQLADLISYSVFRKYEFGNDDLFSIIENRFDSEGGVVHGLYENI